MSATSRAVPRRGYEGERLVSNSSNASEATERLLDRLQRTNNNAEFLATLSKNEV